MEHSNKQQQNKFGQWLKTNTKRSIFYKIIAYLGALFWIIIGIIIIYGALWDVRSSVFGLSIVIGAIFIGIGCYLYIRAKNIICLVQYTKASLINENTRLLKTTLSRFFLLEMVFVLINLLCIGSLLLAVISRVFVDGTPVYFN